MSVFLEILDLWSLVGSGEGTNPNHNIPSFQRELVCSGSPATRGGVDKKEVEIRREIGIQACGGRGLLVSCQLFQAPPNSRRLGGTLPSHLHLWKTIRN